MFNGVAKYCQCNVTISFSCEPDKICCNECPLYRRTSMCCSVCGSINTRPQAGVALYCPLGEPYDPITGEILGGNE